MSYSVQVAIFAALILGVGIAIWSFVHVFYRVTITDESGDVSNAFSLTIEIGIGIFIAISIFLHERAIRHRADVERSKLKDQYVEAISSNLMGLHVSALTTSLNLKIGGYPDNASDESLSDFTKWNISMSRMHFIQTLNHTKALLAYAASTLDSDLLKELSGLLNHIELRIKPEAGYSLRWQAIGSMIEQLAKERLPALSKTLDSNRDFVNNIPDVTQAE